MNDFKRKFLAALLLLQMAVITSPAQTDDAALIAKARGIHARVITLDTHNDIEPSNFTADCNYTMRLTTQVNLPKMVEGGMDVSFMIAYVGQGPLTPEGYDSAYRQAVAKFDAVHQLTEKIAPDQIGLALTPGDVLALHKKNLRIAVIGVENGYPIGTDINRVKEFYDRGGRYMSLAHNGNSQLADSNTGETEGYRYNNGLSPLGREVIAEMNRLGMMVDLSHPSKGANMEAMRISKAPVIASQHPHPYGVFIAGNDMGTPDQTDLYCAAYGNGTFIVRGFGPAPFQMNGGRGAANDAIHKAAGPGEPVSQEVALLVKGDKVSCSINGTEVASYDKSALVTDGKLKSTDGIYGVRFAHNTDVTVTGLTMTKN